MDRLNLKADFALHFSHYLLRVAVFFVSFLFLSFYPTNGPIEDTVKLVVILVLSAGIAFLAEEATSRLVARAELPRAFPPPWEVQMPMEKVVETLRPILESNDVDKDPHIKVSGNLANLSIRMAVKREMLSHDVGHHLDVFIKLDRAVGAATTVTVAYLPSGNWHWMEEDPESQVQRLRAGAYSPIVNVNVRARREAIDKEIRAALQKSAKQQKKESRNRQVAAVAFPAIGTDMNQEQVDYCLQLARQGDADAQFRMGALHDSDGQMNTDLTKSEKYYQAAAEQGHPQAQYRLAMLFWPVGGSDTKQQMFIQWCHEAASNGFRDAQNRLGSYYFEGPSGAQDLSKAEQWWLKAARQKCAESQMAIALMYLNHEATPQGQEDARHWFMEAAKQGNAAAMYHLGRMYEEGLGVGRDSQEAQNWYRRGAEYGSADARAKVSTFS